MSDAAAAGAQGELHSVAPVDGSFPALPGVIAIQVVFLQSPESDVSVLLVKRDCGVVIDRHFQDHAASGELHWPLGLALGTLAGVTVLIALVSEVFVESVQQAATALGIAPAFVGFIIVALVGGAAEMVSAFSAARKNRLDLSVGIALGSAAQIALFVAPVLVLASYVIGPTPMNLQFWPGAVAMILIATMAASLMTNAGRSAWFVGALLTAVYVIFAMTLYLMPPRVQ